jgi:hypothetical protein
MKMTDQGGACRLIAENNVLNTFHGLQMAFFRLFRQGLMACIYASIRLYPGPARVDPRGLLTSAAKACAGRPAQGQSCPVVEGDAKGV